MKKVLSILLIIGVAFTLVACGNNTAPNVKDKIVVAIPQDPDFLDPHKAAASGTEEVMFNVFEGLLKPNSKGELVNAIADSYNVSDDGKTYTFKIKKDVKFHNGELVSMKDVEYSYKRLRGDYSEEPYNSGLKDVGIEVVDDTTIKFMIDELNASFLVYLIEAVIPANMTDEEHNTAPIGTGPYKFIEYTPSQKITLTKFDEYWKKNVASIKDVEFRIFADNQTALMSLQSGAVDLYPRISTEALEQLPETVKYIEGPQNMVQIMAMNNKVEPLNDVRVRQAINYAVNVDDIINTVANGRGIKLGSNMSPAMEFYFQDDLADKYNENVEKAKSLLKQAGYENGFKVSVTVPSNYQFHVDTAQIIANQLSKVGIEVDIVKVEWSSWLSDVYKNRDYEMTIIALTGKLDPHSVLIRYKSDYSRNFMNFNNKRYDELMNQAISTQDQASRANLYKEAQSILADKVPCVFIMDPNLIVAMSKNIEGYESYPIYVQDISTLTFK